MLKGRTPSRTPQKRKQDSNRRRTFC
jgi:hypothetical protein